MRVYKLLEFHHDRIRVEPVTKPIPVHKVQSINNFGYAFDDSDNQVIFDLDYDDSRYTGSMDLKRARDRVKADIRDKTINNILDESI